MFSVKNKSFAVTSANHKHGDRFSVAVDGGLIDVPGERGVGLVVVDYHTRNVSYKHIFDTSQETAESDKLAKAIERIKDGDYVIMGIKGDGSRKLTNDAKFAISNLGSDEIYKLGFEDSWAMIVRKGESHLVREAREHNAVTLQRSDDF